MDYDKHFQEPLKPRECNLNKEQARQRDDFVRRGKSLTGSQQEDLSAYWTWVLMLHGPEILRAFGTHDFLLADLVPTHLIRRHFGAGGAAFADT